MRRIAVVSQFPRGDIPESGVAYYTRTLVASLTRLGFDVSVLANRDGRPEKQIGITRCWRLNLLGAIDICIAISRNPGDIVLIQHTPFLLGEGVSNTYNILVVLLLLKLVRRPVVVELHDIRALADINANLARALRTKIPWQLLRLAYYTLYRYIGILSNAIIVHNDRLAQRVIDDFGFAIDQVHAIELLVPRVVRRPRDECRAKLEISSHKRVALFFGYAIAYKGLGVLLAAAKQLADSCFDSLEIIVVSGRNPHESESLEYESYYRTLEAEFCALANCRWIGFVKDEDVDTYFAACDAVVLPYLVEMSASAPLTQAFAHQKPVLFSDRIAPDDAPAELRFAPNGPALAKLLISLVDNPSLIESGTAFAVDKVERAHGAAEYKKLLTELLEAHETP